MKRFLLQAFLLFPVFAMGAHPEMSPTKVAGVCYGKEADITAHVDFLWWFANVSNSYYAIDKEFVSSGNESDHTAGTLVSRKKEELEGAWNPGFRVGLGVITNYDGWNLDSNWTYFYHSTSSSKSVNSFQSTAFDNTTVNTLGSHVLTSPWFFESDQRFLRRIHGKMKLSFNQVDLELGRSFWLGKFLTVRPFTGLRGFFSRLTYDVRGDRPLLGETSYLEESTNNKQNRWGIGLLGGMNTTWTFAPQWSIFTSGSVALTYGKVDEAKGMFLLEIEPSGNSTRLSTKLSDDYYAMQSFIDLAMGLRFQQIWSQLTLAIDVGYEFHYLYGFNALLVGLNSENGVHSISNGDLALSGLVARFSLNF